MPRSDRRTVSDYGGVQSHTCTYVTVLHVRNVLLYSYISNSVQSR